MPKKRVIVSLLPQYWLDSVIPLLEGGDPERISWTNRALKEMNSVGLGFKHEAYDLCLQILKSKATLGEQIPDMIDETDGTVCDTWAFLCPHPLGIPQPLYVKIGLLENRVSMMFFSLHIDLKGSLENAIRAYTEKNS